MRLPPGAVIMLICNTCANVNSQPHSTYHLSILPRGLRMRRRPESLALTYSPSVEIFNIAGADPTITAGIEVPDQRPNRRIEIRAKPHLRLRDAI